MEFAITVPALLTGSDDSWQPRARSFLFTDGPASRWRSRAACKIGEQLRLTLIAIFGALGTLLVNLSGCFLLGLIGQFTLNRMVISPDWRVAIAVGFFGGYTTFSSFGWETANMLEAGEWAWATAYVGASVVAGVLLSVAGIRLANRF